MLVYLNIAAWIAAFILSMLGLIDSIQLRAKNKRLEASVSLYCAACTIAERRLSKLNDASSETAAFIREVGQGKIDVAEISDFQNDMLKKRPLLPLTKASEDVIRERMTLEKEEVRRARRLVSDKPNSRAMAGVCYAMIAATPVSQRSVYLKYFPWGPADWQPSDQRGNLVRAAALIVTAIELYDQQGRQETKAAA